MVLFLTGKKELSETNSYSNEKNYSQHLTGPMLKFVFPDEASLVWVCDKLK